MCSELSPRARIPDTRIPHLMQPCHTCGQFEPTMLEGQLCYSLNLKHRGKTTRSGKSKGLFLLLDPSPYQLNVIDKYVLGSKTRFSAKVHIQTLESFTTFGPGSLMMDTLKKMTGTQRFMELPDIQKKCSPHNREECQTQKYLDQVRRECNCVPWASTTNMIDKVQVIKTKPTIDALITGFESLWPPRGRVCCKPNMGRRKLPGSLYWSIC